MIIKVKVKPKSGREEIVKLDEENYLVFLKEKAEEGKANREPIKILSKEFDVDFSKIKIKTPKSKNKIVELII
ncbi:DUF167 domain-containing protein [Candidatus Pacearchaeota archaeon]|nr:DUF167 domain-containing protein [Candidatus Pacearchaeota archaeon]